MYACTRLKDILCTQFSGGSFKHKGPYADFYFVRIALIISCVCVYIMSIYLHSHWASRWGLFVYNYENR